MSEIGEFLTGVKEKYPAQLLKGRIQNEGNVISCFFKDMLLLDDTTFESKDFITTDGLFYFSLYANGPDWICLCPISGDLLHKNDSGLKSFFAFYSICLLFAGIYGILKKRIRRISVLRRQGTVYAVRRVCRQKRS